MKFIVYICCWYVIVFVVYLLEVAWHCWCSRVSTHLHEPVLVLKAGETVLGVADGPHAIRFYIGDVVDEKKYE